MAMTSEETTKARTGDGNRNAYGFVALLAAAIIGFGIGFLVFDTGDDPPDEVTEVLDAYIQAWEDTDGIAVVELMTIDGTHNSDGNLYSGDELVSLVDRAFLGVQVTSGDLTVYGDGPYVAVQDTQLNSVEGVSVFYLVDERGEVRIDSHTWHRQ